jgi:hypothetical protein
MGHQRSSRTQVLIDYLAQPVVNRWRRCAQQRRGMERDTRKIYAGSYASGRAPWDGQQEGATMVERMERRKQRELLPVQA